MSLPKLVVFDLDDTLWSPEMWLCAGPPFTKNNSTKAVCDRSGTEIQLIGASREILHELATNEKWRDSRVGYASRTDREDWARECLQMIEVGDSITMDQVARPLQEIFPGKKTTHFKNLHETSRIPLADMIFFDNEHRNCKDVSALGVTCVYTPDGMTKRNWEEGLKTFAQKKRS
ncbi:hypothetical protein CYMTET_7559 [Cymbomonas tetramitiformis]|uniref:Magnesium-dependent phosphatase-1 n=1 Tax=Cymbomonas tetramitiformis TaxID=36881 RepID=A0AAE0GUS6_9CHLO|nr:hypothetical protein CYMTET_7559 [Cymbomonas tetramitiformis]